MHVHLITGARPNYMKIWPIWRALKAERSVEVTWVNTGQHSDPRLSEFFIRELFDQEPDFNLPTPGGDLFKVKAHIEAAYASLLDRIGVPDWVFIPGDVVSSAAVWYVAATRGIEICHIEAGLRSDFDEYEEIHRKLIDSHCALFLTHSEDADRHLEHEGRAANVHRVGNFMIDTLRLKAPDIEASSILRRTKLREHDYVVVTLHHRFNVADLDRLRTCCEQLARLTGFKVIFPVHLRTQAALRSEGLHTPLREAGVELIDPLPYADFLRLVRDAAYVITDSDGLQEECAYLKKICFAVRPTTARPVTMRCGSTILIEPSDIAKTPTRFRKNSEHVIGDIATWDGNATERLLEVLRDRHIVHRGGSDERQFRKISGARSNR